MRTTRRVDRLRRVATAGMLALALLGVGACSGPPSHDPSPKKWEEDDGPPPSVMQPPSDGGEPNTGDGGDTEGGGGEPDAQVELCATVDVGTVQQSFQAAEEPTTSSGEQTLGMEGLTPIGGCTYEWSAGSLTVTAAVAESGDDSATYLQGLASAAGLSGDPVEGLGEASLVDTSGSAQSEAAVALGVTDVEGTKTVVVMVGPLDSDASAYAQVGSTVLDTVA